MSENNKISDKSHDTKYFTINPRIVKYYSRSPYDYALWDTVKEVAGDSRECFLSTEDLAILSGMSAGKVSECRKYWIDLGFLEGELRRDPGYPQPVWHLAIPNLWSKNIQWAEEHLSIQSRIDFKKSLHQVKPSPGEEGIPPGEEGIPPGEAKNIRKNIQKDKKNNGGDSRRDALLAGMPIDWKLMHGQPISKADLEREKREKFERDAREVAESICHNLEDGIPLAMAFMLTRGILLNGEKSGHRRALRQMLETKPRRVKPEHISKAIFDLKSQGLTVKDLFSVVGTARDLANPMPDPAGEVKAIDPEKLEQLQKHAQEKYSNWND